MLMMAVVFTVGCTPEKEVKVTTSTPHDITLITAVCGGEVKASEGVTLTELGVCWDTVKDPTVNNDHLFTSNWTEPYEDTIKDLMPGTEYHVRAYAYNGSDYFYGEDKSFTTDGGGSGGSGGGGTNDSIPPGPPEPDPRFVDLGLPSGTLWATRNVGANAPEEYGDYFAWGETEPKSVYSWETYKYGHSWNDLTKYCSNPDCGHNGFVDNLTILQPEDDAAAVNWGGDARMPTFEEIDELYENTTNIWTNLNGIDGSLITGSNGNSIFLPAAGWRWDGELSYIGQICRYWLSSRHWEDSQSAWYFEFPQTGAFGDYRCLGHSVRPVRSAR